MPKIVNYVGQTYENAYGKYTVIADLGLIYRRPDGRMSRMLRVKFHNSGEVYDVLPESITSKFGVRDYRGFRFFGVGRLGDGIEQIYDYGNTKEYKLWYDMLSRCYNKEDSTYPTCGGIGVRVSDRWLVFVNFYYDIRTYDNYDMWMATTRQYELNKDYLQRDTPPNQRIYDYTTCCLLPKTHDLALRHRAEEALDERHPYPGVTKLDSGNYRTRIYNRSTTPDIDAVFSDPYSAAVYNAMYKKYQYGKPYYGQVDMTYNNFIQAQNNRIIQKDQDRYKIMYHLINKKEEN